MPNARSTAARAIAAILLAALLASCASVDGYIASGKFPEAEESLAKLQPAESAGGYAKLGDAYLAAKQYPKAEAAYAKASPPASEAGYARLGDAYLAAKEYDKAEAAYAKSGPASFREAALKMNAAYMAAPYGQNKGFSFLVKAGFPEKEAKILVFDEAMKQGRLDEAMKRYDEIGDPARTAAFARACLNAALANAKAKGASKEKLQQLVLWAGIAMTRPKVADASLSALLVDGVLAVAPLQETAAKQWELLGYGIGAEKASPTGKGAALADLAASVCEKAKSDEYYAQAFGGFEDPGLKAKLLASAAKSASFKVLEAELAKTMPDAKARKALIAKLAVEGGSIELAIPLWKQGGADRETGATILKGLESKLAQLRKDKWLGIAGVYLIYLAEVSEGLGDFAAARAAALEAAAPEYEGFSRALDFFRNSGRPASEWAPELAAMAIKKGAFAEARDLYLSVKDKAGMAALAQEAERSGREQAAGKDAGKSDAGYAALELAGSAWAYAGETSKAKLLADYLAESGRVYYAASVMRAMGSSEAAVSGFLGDWELAHHLSAKAYESYSKAKNAAGKAKSLDAMMDDVDPGKKIVGLAYMARDGQLAKARSIAAKYNVEVAAAIPSLSAPLADLAGAPQILSSALFYVGKSEFGFVGLTLTLIETAKILGRKDFEAFRDSYKAKIVQAEKIELGLPESATREQIHAKFSELHAKDQAAWDRAIEIDNFNGYTVSPFQDAIRVAFPQ